MKLLHILSLTLLLSTASFGYANERTAGGNLSDQASWSALQNLINKNSSELAITKIDIAAMKACMAQGMLYGPGPDADEKGCRSAGEGHYFYCTNEQTDGDGVLDKLDCIEAAKQHPYHDAPPKTPPSIIPVGCRTQSNDNLSGGFRTDHVRWAAGTPISNTKINKWYTSGECINGTALFLKLGV